MLEQERVDFKEEIERIVRETVDDNVLEHVAVDISPDHDGDTAVYVILDLQSGLSSETYARIATDLGQRLVDHTHTPDGFLFPYIRMRTERDVA